MMASTLTSISSSAGGQAPPAATSRLRTAMERIRTMASRISWGPDHRGVLGIRIVGQRRESPGKVITDSQERDFTAFGEDEHGITHRMLANKQEGGGRFRQADNANLICRGHQIRRVVGRGRRSQVGEVDGRRIDAWVLRAGQGEE